MTEIWLRSNRRILGVGLIPGALISLAAVGLAMSTASKLLFYFAVVSFFLGIALFGVVLRQFLRPRVAYEQGKVLFYLRAGDPIAVPVQVVEAFFLGQGPAYLPGQPEDSEATINLVARLSQKAPEWERVEVKPTLGRWCESYVSIRGTWCEPLTNDVIRHLNRRLSEVSREILNRTQNVEQSS